MPAFLIPRYSLYCGSGSTVDDARLLMRSAYHYWYHKGFWGVLGASLVNTANALILFIATFLLTVCFRWDQARACVETECSVPSLFSTCHRPFIHTRSTLGYLGGSTLLLSTGIGAVYESMHAVATHRVQSQLDVMVREMNIDVGFDTPYHRFCHHWSRTCPKRDGYRLTDTLLHDKPALRTMSWNQFLEHLCAYVTREKKLRACATGAAWDPVRAVQTLLWEENLLVMLQELGALDDGAMQYLDTSTVRTLLSALLDPFQSLITDADGGGAECVRRVHLRAVRYAQCYLIFYAFVAVFFFLKVLSKNAAALKRNVTTLRQYRWNSRARWTFRLYNEVDHLLDCRLQNAETEAVDIVGRLSVHTNLSRLVRRASSTCVLTVVALSLLNPSLLVMGTFMGVSFVWWLSISLLLFAGFPKPDPRAREYDYTPDLNRLTNCLHHDEPEWRASGDAFLRHVTHHFLDSVWMILVKDVVCVLSTPFVLLAATRDGSLRRLCETARLGCGVVDGVGSVPFGALFDRASCSDDDELDGSMSPPDRGVLFQAEADEGGLSTQDHHHRLHLMRSRGKEKATLSAASFIAVYGWHHRGSDEDAVGEGNDRESNSLTRALLEQWRRVFPDETPTGAHFDHDGEAGSSEMDELLTHPDTPLTPTSASSPGSATPRGGVSLRLSPSDPRPTHSSRSGRQTERVGNVANAHANLTAHERESRFVTAVRLGGRVKEATPHSPRTARTNSTYGTAQRAHSTANQQLF